MELGKPKIGELVAAVGVVLGFVALWTTVFERAGYQYKDDGTYLTALIIALGLAACCLAASLLLGKMHLDLAAAHEFDPLRSGYLTQTIEIDRAAARPPDRADRRISRMPPPSTPSTPTRSVRRRRDGPP